MHRSDLPIVIVGVLIFLGITLLLGSKISHSFNCRAAGGTPMGWQCVKFPLVEID